MVKFVGPDGKLDAAHINNVRPQQATPPGQRDRASASARPWGDVTKSDIGRVVEDRKGRRGIIYQVGRGGAVAARGADGKAIGIPPGEGRIVESRSGPPSSSSVVASGTAHFESIPWVDNADGSVRTIDEAITLAKQYGLEIPDDIDWNIVEEGDLKPGVWATYGSLRKSPDYPVTWFDLCNRFGRISVQLHRRILESDEACVAVMAHEMHEVQELRRRLANAPNKTMQFRHFQALVDADLNGSLHMEALGIANAFILRMREKRP